MPTMPLKKPFTAALNTYPPAPPPSGGTNTPLVAALSSSPSSVTASTSYSLGPNAPAVHLGGLPGSIGPTGVGEGFVFDPEIAAMIFQLWTRRRAMKLTRKQTLLDIGFRATQRKKNGRKILCKASTTFVVQKTVKAVEEGFRTDEVEERE